MVMRYFDEENYRGINFSKRAILLGKWLCIISIVLPFLNFMGRYFHIGLMTRFHEDLPAMTPNTSIALIVLSLAILILLNNKSSAFKKYLLVFCSVALFIGLATMWEHISQIDLGIDNLGRPSFFTALNFFLMSIAIFLAYKRKARHLFHYITLFVMSICLVVITGYLFSTKNFHGFPIFPGAVSMALNTAIAFILLSVALLCVDPKDGFMKLLTSNTQSGHFARGMSLAILIVPPALGLLTRLSTIFGIIDVTMQISIFMMLLIAFWFGITWRLTKKGEEKEIKIRFLTQKLKASEEKVKLTLEKASDGIFTADHNGYYTDVNEAGCRLLGLSRKEIIGKHIKDFIPKSELPKLEEKMKSLKNDKLIPLTEWNMKTHSGEYIPVEVSDTVLKDGRWIGIVRDISERIEARKKLQNSEQKFRGLLEAAQDAIVIVDSKGLIVFINQQTLNWFGYKESELYQRPIEILVPDHFKDKHIIQRNGFLESPIARPMGRGIELFGRRKDGSEFPVEVALSPSMSAEGRLVTAVIRDITEAKKREQETHFLAEIGKSLSESLDPDIILSLSAELIVPRLADCCIIRNKDEDGRFRAKKIVHRDPAKVQRFMDYTNMVVDSTEIHNTLDDMILKGETFVSIEGIRTAPLSIKPELQEIIKELNIHSFIVVPLKPKNDVLGTISFILTDSTRSFELSDVSFFERVTQRISLSLENAKLYRDATQAIKTREDVLSVVSHDLKNPLAFITLKTQLLGKSKEITPEKLADFTKGISKATGQMQHLIDDLLDFAKLESGTFTLDLAPHNVNSLINPLIEIISAQAAEKQITFDVQIKNHMAELVCDADRIRQVLSNLLGNAIKFTQNGGAISLAIQGEESGTLFCVTDNGPGIPEEHLEKIFDRFWQLENTKKMGSGLGLSICKAIVQAHGGKIWAESKEMKGSRFYFSIPSRLA